MGLSIIKVGTDEEITDLDPTFPKTCPAVSILLTPNQDNEFEKSM